MEQLSSRINSALSELDGELVKANTYHSLLLKCRSNAMQVEGTLGKLHVLHKKETDRSKKGILSERIDGLETELEVINEKAFPDPELLAAKEQEKEAEAARALDAKIASLYTEADELDVQAKAKEDASKKAAGEDEDLAADLAAQATELRAKATSKRDAAEKLGE